MKILVTGARGFIGQNLLPYLRKALPDIEIHTLGRDHCDHSWTEVSEAALQPYDAIVHLAGKAHDTRNTSAPDSYFEVNTTLTRQLYDAYKSRPGGKFIFVSSVKAAADSVEGVLTEETPAQPQTPYGQSKRAAEEHIESNAGALAAFYILRPCMVHGPGNKGNLNLLYQFARKGIPYPLAAFNNERSFLSVENFCYVLQELLVRNIPSGIYQLADDQALSTNQLMEIIAAASGRRAQLWKVSPALIRLLARAGDVLHLPLNSERLRKLTENYVVSNNRIRNALGISALPVSATEGLTKTIRSFAAHSSSKP